MRILFVGDIVSQSGCDFLKNHLSSFKKLKQIDLCIVNGENSAVGNGITPHSAQSLFSAGADAITLGNHALKRPEIYEYLDNFNNPVVRPANFSDKAPGRGSMIIDLGYTQVGLINLIGAVYMQICENPFTCADREIESLKNQGVKNILIDFHAEATAEKKALAYYLDGRVSAVVCTHTHVQTADEQILENSTAYITDLGMTGPTESVLGVTKECAIEKMITNLPVRFTNPQTDLCCIEGVIIDIDHTCGKAKSIERIQIR